MRLVWVAALLCACESAETTVDATARDASVSDVGADAGASDLGIADAAPTDTGAMRCVRPLSVERVEDLGALSLPSPVVLSRDGASAGMFAGRLVWTFGDTFLTQRNPIDNSSVLSATAGLATVESPRMLQEPVDDAGFPNQLIPYTEEELRLNRADALNGWALWPGAVIDTGSPEALVLFQRIKRTSGSGFDSMGIGTGRLAANATRATRGASDLFAAMPDSGVPSLYGSGGVSVLDGYAYFFVCSTVGFLNAGCRVARAPVARADDRAAFTFFDGTTWQQDLARASVVIDHVAGGLSITRNPYLGCYLAVTGALLRSALTMRVSEHLESGWGELSAGVTIESAADGGVLPAASDAYDYLFLEHPELRSADGRQVVVSYSRPLGNFRGEVRLARITLR